MKFRSPKFQFENVPNHWFEGNALKTYFGNVFHATIPSGERFIIRAVAKLKHSLPAVEQATVRVFLGQEGQHAAAHDAFSRVLSARGYDPVRIARTHDRVYARLERIFPDVLKVSIAAGVEHYTALLGDDALSRQDEFKSSHPGVKALMLWHAAEEVEHRSVIFDILKSLNRSYALRATGFVLATVALWISTTLSFLHFVRRDPEKPRLKLLREALSAFVRFPYVRTTLLSLEYLRPGFHPSQRGETARAVEFLTAIESGGSA